MKKKKIFAMSMLIFCATFLGCASGIKIPDTKIFKEIPFVDGAEGVSYTIRSEVATSYGPNLWAKKRAELVCLDADGWYEIKQSWLHACRYAGRSCDLEVKTVETTIRALDDLAKRVVEGQKLQ